MRYFFFVGLECIIVWVVFIELFRCYFFCSSCLFLKDSLGVKGGDLYRGVELILV